MSIFGKHRDDEDLGGFHWSFSSEKDPRFSGSGTTYGLFGAHAEIDRQIKALEDRFGCKAPDDIVCGGMKD